MPGSWSRPAIGDDDPPASRPSIGSRAPIVPRVMGQRHDRGTTLTPATSTPILAGEQVICSPSNSSGAGDERWGLPPGR